MAEPAQDLTPPIPFSNTPALATADVISLAEVAAKRAAKFAAMVDTLEAKPAARAAEVGRSLEGVGMPKRDVEAAPFAASGRESDDDRRGIGGRLRNPL